MEQYIIIFAKEGFETPIWTFTDTNVERILGMFAAGNGIVSDLNYDLDYERSNLKMGNKDVGCEMVSCRITLEGKNTSYCQAR